MNLNQYLSIGITAITGIAGRFYLNNKNGQRFMAELIPALQADAGIRSNYEQNGVHIPPFLIASVASQCNLFCSGCYARAGGSCGSNKKESEMSAMHWEKIFWEADQLGVSFILLAGGEPLLRREIMETAVRFRNMIFPVFTNGTMIDRDYIEMFDKNRNLVPVLSVEGSADLTDLRRGEGVSEKIELVMEHLKQRKILFGVSVTVTQQNLKLVADESYVSELLRKGCGVIFFVEYVPASEGTEDLVLSAENIAFMDRRMAELKSSFKTMILLSFPGDEKYMGGCLAAGRGFFHINPEGGAEPCPFSPYSEVNLKNESIMEVLQSSFFKNIRAISAREEIHQGGCTLFRHKQEIGDLL